MTNDSFKPEPLQEENLPGKRVRKPRKKASADGPPIVAQTICDDTGFAAAPVEKRKRAGRPRKLAPVAAASVEMIRPDEPIVFGRAAALPFAVPVGKPYPSTSCTNHRSSALTPEALSLRSTMLVPAQYDRVAAKDRSRWLRHAVAKTQMILSGATNILRRHPRAAGLIMTAILLGITLATVAILSDRSGPDVAIQKTEEPRLAAAPSLGPPVDAQSAAVEENDSLAGVRIVDPSWDKKSSCSEGTWPYIEQRCLVKDETGKGALNENKIGPRMIDSRVRPPAPEPDGPIGSSTLVAPAAPKVSTTNGIAPRNVDQDDDEELTSNPAADAVPVQVSDTRASAMPVQAVTSRVSIAPSKYRSARALRRSDEISPAAPRRVTNAKRKRHQTVADAGRKARTRTINTVQAPQFFFPFGWFVQAR